MSGLFAENGLLRAVLIILVLFNVISGQDNIHVSFVSSPQSTTPWPFIRGLTFEDNEHSKNYFCFHNFDRLNHTWVKS